MKRLFLILFLCALLGCEKGPEYGSYSIGRDQSWFPLNLGLKTVNLNAFTNALVQAISKEEDLFFRIVDIDWGQLFQSLENNEVAGIFTALPPNKITLSKYSFSDPFLFLGPVLVVPIHSTATSLSDLKGKIVAVNQFDESVLIVQPYPSIVIKLYQQMPTILEKLVKGEVDAVLMPVLDAESLVPSIYSEKLKIVTAPLNNKALRLITLKDQNSALIQHFNLGLKKLKSASNYRHLRNTFEVD